MSAKDTIVTLVIGAKDRASKTLNAFDKSLGGVKAKVAAVGATIAAYFGAKAISKFFGSAVNDAAEFEAQMDKVAAVSGATAEELEQLTATAQKMGAETSFTATESAQALELLARAGLGASDSIGTLPVVLDLAKGSGLEMAEAASQITSTTSAMGYSFDQAARVADVLTKTAASANTNVQQLGNAMSYAGPVAASLGLEMEDVAAIIGKFSDAGIRGERAGTALRSVLAQMSDPASKASKALRDLGIATDDPIEAIKELAKAGPAGKAAVREFGLEAGPSLQALLNQGTAGLEDLRNKLDDAAGSSANAAAIMADNVPGALKGLGSVWDSIKQKLATPLLEPIKLEILDLTARLREFSNSEEIQQFADSLVTGFKNVAASTKEFLAGFDFKEAMRNTGEFVENVASNLKTLGTTLTVVGQSIRLFLNGFAAGVKTIGGLVSAVFAAIVRDAATVLDFMGADEWAAKASNIANALTSVSRKFEQEIAEDRKDIDESFSKISAALSSTQDEYIKTARAADESGKRQKDAAKGAADAVEKVTEEVEKAKDAIEEPVDGEALEKALGSVSEASKRLGIDIEQSLGKTTAATRAALTDISTLSEGIQAAGYTTQEQSAIMKAALENAFNGAKTKEDVNAINATLQELANQGLITAEHLLILRQASESSLDSMSDNSKKNTDSMIEDLRRLRREQAGLGSDTEDTTEKVEQQEKATGGAAAAIAGHLNRLRDKYAELGDAAVAAYDEMLEGSVIVGESVHVFVERFNKDIEKLNARLEDAQQLQGSWADRTITDLQDLEAASERTLNATLRNAEGMEYLDQTRLDAIRSEVDRLRQANEQLEESLQSTINTLRDELDQMDNNQAAIEQRDYERRKQELEQQLEEARKGGNQQAQRDADEALRLLEQIHRKKMDDIKAEAVARTQAEREQIERDREREQERSDQGNAPASTRTTTEAQTIKVVEHRINDKRVRVLESDSDDLIDILEKQQATAS